MDLSLEKPFRLGSANVTPATLRVACNGHEETLQPRVMEVLLVLAGAGGAVVSRDALIEQCWGQRFTSDDAVNRIVAKLRQVANRCGAFEVETVSRVGFRLVQLSSTSAGEAGADNVPAGLVPKLARRRPRTLAAATGAALLLAAGGITLGLHAGSAAAAPEVAIEPFDVLAPSLPTTFSADVREDMLMTFQPGVSAVAIKAAEPGQDRSAFRVRGRIEQDGDLVEIYARLEPPDGSQILWSHHYEVPLERARAPTIGHEMMMGVACVMRAGAGSNAPGMASPALAPWADFCAETVSDEPDLYREVAALRQTVALAPGFYDAEAFLGSNLGLAAEKRPPGERKALFDEAEAAVARAEKLDPSGGDAYWAEGTLWWATDPARAEGLFLKALSVPRPMKNPFPRASYARLLESVGRIDEAMDQHHQLLAVTPNNVEDQNLLAVDLAIGGRTDDAQDMMAQLQRQRMNLCVSDWRLDFAIWARNRPAAKALAVRKPGCHYQPGQDELVDALASDDRGKLGRASAAFETQILDPAASPLFTSQGLALTGHPQAALAILSKLVDKDRFQVLYQTYMPPYAEARRTPEYEALVTRAGLMDYWKRSGHAPDFCKSPDAPAFCSRLAG